MTRILNIANRPSRPALRPSPAMPRSPARKSKVIALVRRQFLSAADTETASAILWFAAIQGIKRNQDLTGLAPKGCFIAAQAIEREVWQIGKTQKATREISVRIDGTFERLRHGAGLGFCSVMMPCDAGSRSRLTESSLPNGA